MPHVVTQSCCSDGSCTFACPVNCIHPTPDEPDFATAEMVYIDPATCVDCGACIAACPVGAIVPHTRIPVDQLDFLDVNAEFYRAGRDRPLLAPRTPPLRLGTRRGPLRVAVVGSGPAAMYAADELLTVPGAQVDVYERLERPYGLARWGVAPDHARTRAVSGLFDLIVRQRGLRMHLGVEIGRDLTHDDLLGTHDAVVYAVGAAADRRLDVPGADLASTATEFVAWYNGHPDHAGRTYDLSGPRVVVIGNGNVALDVARILATDPERLAATDISPAALAALRGSAVEEVVVVGRRGPEHAAFTLPELIGLVAQDGLDVSVPPADLAGANAAGTDPATATKLRILAEQAGSAGRGRSIVFRFGLTPQAVTGTGVQFRRTTAGDELVHLDAGLVLTSIGYHGRPVPDLPFDAVAGVVPNKGGRVTDPLTGEIVPRTYVAGWIKRGPTGFIGTNKSCSLETVRALVEDHT